MCDNMTTQMIPKGWDYVERPIKCGNTTIHGDTALCSECMKLNDGRPWWMCPHGVDLSEREMACGLCNALNE